MGAWKSKTAMRLCVISQSRQTLGHRYLHRGPEYGSVQPSERRGFEDQHRHSHQDYVLANKAGAKKESAIRVSVSKNIIIVPRKLRQYSHLLKSKLCHPSSHKRVFLEKHNFDIADYAKHFYSENQKYDKIITRHDIEWYWKGNIRAEFVTVNSSHNQLVSQTRCPKFKIFYV